MNNFFRHISISLIAIFLAVSLAACGQNAEDGNKTVVGDSIKTVSRDSAKDGDKEYNKEYSNEDGKKTDERLTKDLIRCRYYNEAEFMQSIRVANKVEAYDGDIAGGIVPHHLLACDLIASFF